jgi:hypothetical protein
MKRDESPATNKLKAKAHRSQLRLTADCAAIDSSPRKTKPLLPAAPHQSKLSAQIYHTLSHLLLDQHAPKTLLVTPWDPTPMTYKPFESPVLQA